MATVHTHKNDIIDVGPAGTSSSTTLVETEHLKVVRLAIAADQSRGAHMAPGDMTIECIEGQVVVSFDREMRTLSAGQLMFVPTGMSHALRGLKDSLLLLTIAEPRTPALRNSDEFGTDVIEEASQESFPASDPPAWSPVIRP